MLSTSVKRNREEPTQSEYSENTKILDFPILQKKNKEEEYVGIEDIEIEAKIKDGSDYKKVKFAPKFYCKDIRLEYFESKFIKSPNLSEEEEKIFSRRYALLNDLSLDPRLFGDNSKNFKLEGKCELNELKTKDDSILIMLDAFLNSSNDLTSYNTLREDKKCVGLLYTGGKDSVYRLLHLLEQGENVIIIMNGFNTFKFDFKITRRLVINTLHQIKDLCIAKPEIFKGKIAKVIELATLDVNFGECAHHGFSQQQFNAFSLSYIGPSILKCIKRFEMCLVQEDESVGWINDLKAVYNSGMKFNSATIYDNDDLKIPKLEFPLLKHSKYRIKSYLDNFCDLHKINLFTPSCEIERYHFAIKFSKKERVFKFVLVYRACNSCGSCKRMNYSNIKYRRSGLVEIGSALGLTHLYDRFISPEVYIFEFPLDEIESESIKIEEQKEPKREEKRALTNYQMTE